MSLLAAASAPREVEFPVYRGAGLPLAWRTDTVGPPSTGDALVVLHLSSEPERAGHRSALLAVARRWLPPRAAADLAALTDQALARALLGLVGQASGLSPEGGQQGGPTDAAEKGAELLDDTVLALASQLGVPPDHVLREMSWPTFLATAEALPRFRALDDLRTLYLNGIPHMEKADHQAALARLQEEAGLTENAAQVTPPVRYSDNPAVWEAKGMTREEHEAARREALDAWKRRSAEAAAEMAERRGPKAEA